MDITQWYGVGLGALAIAFCTFGLFIKFALSLGIKFVRTRTTVFFLKHIFYPRVHPLLGEMTRFNLILVVIFILGNILCVTIGIHNFSDLSNRTALASTINLIPLFLGGHMNWVVSRCGISFESYSCVHRWLGRVSIAEGILHAIIASVGDKAHFRSQSQKAGLIAVSTMAAILLLSTAVARRLFYEVFARSHFILTYAVLVSIWFHVPSGAVITTPRLYLLIAACLQAAVSTLRFGQMIYRNIPLNEAVIESHVDAVTIRIKISRPWKYRAGQYIWLCMPEVSLTSLVQLHPFMISGWYSENENDKEVDKIVLLAQERKGFTSNLHRIKNCKRKAIIDGPYGNELHLESYDTVLLFATGIGIAAQLPYVKQLLDGYQRSEVKTPRIALFWEIESEFHRYWVGDIMNDFMSLDIGFKLDIHLYILGNYISRCKPGGVTHPPKKNKTERDRISFHWYSLDAKDVIRSELKNQKGKTIISLCTNDHTNRNVREELLKMLDKSIHLEELEFRPCMPTNSEYRWRSPSRHSRETEHTNGGK